ncbi:MAG: hypothetical protein JST28_15675 [Acidobacteria bacterium]|nr:hypothetical protein [Acidobacteriota bacterium]
MFERYTEKARRVIFYGRYEASQFGQPYIETEHLLLGLLREDKALGNRFLRPPNTVESIRRQIESHTPVREKISTSVDLPLSNECKRAMAYAAEEAERLRHNHIGTEHLLLGLLREENCFAQQLLAGVGITLAKTREEVAKVPPDRSGETVSAPMTQRLGELCVDLTQRALDGDLEPVLGRDVEVQAIIEVLCRKERRNPVLLGGKGVGKSAIVHAFAQRVADGKVPTALADMRVLALSPEALAAWNPGREKFEELAKVLGTAAASENLILFVDGLRGSTGVAKSVPGQELTGVMRFILQETKTLCIAVAAEEEYRAACENYPGLDKLFRLLHVRQLAGEQVLAVLRVHKEKFERFHGAGLSEDALQCAVANADRYLKERVLPGKALELLDSAAAAVKARSENDESLPGELKACKARLKFIAARLENAVGNHELEKVRFYTEEQLKEQNNLAELEKKFGLENQPVPTVTWADVEQVIAKWNSYPYSA